jgi:phosphatidylinositol dimannoside acyltransferase
VSLDPAFLAYRAGSAVARALPRPVAMGVADLGGRAAARVLGGRRRMVERHQRRAQPGISEREVRRASRDAFRSYARYWVESFRLPSTGREELDRRFAYRGYEHIVAARERGIGAIIALPHLGGWEWAAFWVAVIEDVPVSAVVEPLEPPELFAWFAEFRRSLGMDVIPLGPTAGARSIAALKEGNVLCLLCDRDIGGGGIEVEFFGERTTLPAGPVTLALRTGAPLLPSAIYFDGDGHLADIGPPMLTDRRGSLRDDVTRLTQDLARELEARVRRAPDQWHLMSPNWPSDTDTG